MTLKARITNKFHSARLQPGGGAREVTIVQAFIDTDDPTPRSFGPLEKTFDRTVDQTTIDLWLAEEVRALEGRV